MTNLDTGRESHIASTEDDEGIIWETPFTPANADDYVLIQGLHFFHSGLLPVKINGQYSACSFVGDAFKVSKYLSKV
jgi:hypothetical protein